jgi:hypothetical protein
MRLEVAVATPGVLVNREGAAASAQAWPRRSVDEREAEPFFGLRVPEFAIKQFQEFGLDFVQIVRVARVGVPKCFDLRYGLDLDLLSKSKTSRIRALLPACASKYRYQTNEAEY